MNTMKTTQAIVEDYTHNHYWLENAKMHTGQWWDAKEAVERLEKAWTLVTGQTLEELAEASKRYINDRIAKGRVA